VLIIETETKSLLGLTANAIIVNILNAQQPSNAFLGTLDMEKYFQYLNAPVFIAAKLLGIIIITLATIKSTGLMFSLFAVVVILKFILTHNLSRRITSKNPRAKSLTCWL
jgi:hypothetical protein